MHNTQATHTCHIHAIAYQYTPTTESRGTASSLSLLFLFSLSSLFYYEYMQELYSKADSHSCTSLYAGALLQGGRTVA